MILFLLVTSAIAASYAVLAQLGFLVAIPPGNVTAIWPPSGLAVAVVLLLGYRRASLGIALGSLAANVWVLGNGNITPAYLVASALIALGSAAQASAAAAALRRTIGWAHDLPSARAPSSRRYQAAQLIRFAAVAALSCLIAATVGVTALWLAGLTATEAYAGTWAIWWLGDYVGILVLTPPLVILGRRLLRNPELYSVALLVADLGLVASVLVFFGARGLESQRIASDFSSAARAAEIDLRDSIGLAAHDLDTLSTLFKMPAGITRSQFQSFAQPYLANKHAIAGVQALGWARYVAAADRAAFEAANFPIVERAATRMVPAAARPEYVAITFADSASHDTIALGYDLGSEPVRRAAMLQARDSGQVGATATIRLLTNNQPGFLMFLPVYDAGAPIDTVAQRRAAIAGFVLGVYRTSDLLGPTLQNPDLSNLDLYIFEQVAPGEDGLVYTNANPPPGASQAAVLAGTHYTASFDIGGHEWQLVVRPAPAYAGTRRTWLPWIALIAGLGLTALGTISLAERQQSSMALERSEQRFRALIEKSANVIALLSADGHIIYNSPNYEQALGYPPGSRLNSNGFELVHPEDLAGTMALFSDVARQPGATRSIELRALHKDGSWQWLACSATNLLDEPAVGAIIANFNNITKRKQTELALAASEARFRSYIEHAPIAIFVADRNGRYTESNHAAELLLGYGAEELRQIGIADVLPDEGRAAGLQAFATVVARGAAEGEFQFKHRNGRLVWVSLRAIKIDSDHLLAFCLDISEHKLIEQTLQEKLELEEQIAKIAVTAPGGLCALRQRPDGTMYMSYASPVWEAIYGLRFEEVSSDGSRMFEVIHPEDRAHVQHTLAESARTLEPWSVEFRLQHPQRGEVWVEGKSNPLREADGSTLWHGFITDTTAHKQAQARDAAHRAMLEKVIQLSKIITPMAGLQRCLLQIYSSIRQGLGFDRVGLFLHDKDTGQVLGTIGTTREGALEDISWIVQPDTAKPWQQVLNGPQGLCVSEDYTQDYQLPPEHRMYGVKHHLVLAGWVGNRPVALIAVDNLISGRPISTENVEALMLLAGYAALAIENARWNAQLEQLVAERTTDLSRANLQLTKALSAKDEFLATMSHELRTPLNSILALSELLGEQVRGALNERQLSWVHAIESSGRHLLALINDILDLSKIEAGRLDMQFETVLLDDICQSSLLFIKELASKKNLRVAFSCNDTSAQLEADPRRLKQILVNLLSNAVKFTAPGGSVELRVSADAEAQVIRFAVMDTGIGIAPADIGRLFLPFTQLDSGLARQFEGTGLGLALVHRLSERHGGSVNVASAGVPGQGSTFTVAIPWRRPAGGEAP
ncbi:MAG TPA: PAS domain S-box protein, partial [Kouleothrix sp.]|nr:PAS domain S-box protein [Kouleothrix sp.]